MWGRMEVMAGVCGDGECGGDGGGLRWRRRACGLGLAAASTDDPESILTPNTRTHKQTDRQSTKRHSHMPTHNSKHVIQIHVIPAFLFLFPSSFIFLNFQKYNIVFKAKAIRRLSKALP